MSLALEPGTIIVGVDGSADADRALRWAAVQASLERRPLALVASASLDQLGDVAWAGVGGYVVPATDLVERAQGVAEKAAAAVRRLRTGLAVTAHAAQGDPRVVLVGLSRNAHLLVVGSRGRGVLRSRLLGSVSTAVSRHAHCPVVVCRPESPGKVRRGVLVGADGTAEGQAVLEFAFQHASMHRLPLTVLHSFSDVVAALHGAHVVNALQEDLEEERLLLAEALAGFSEKYPEVHVEGLLARGLAYECLAADSERWHLVVVGRHPTESLGRMVSATVATAVVERAHTTVAVVPVPAPH
ncbi:MULTISPECIES: universal stress protein [Nocardioides]|uniref:Universal stress protein n=1 Tax=Nocardioides vastitatis TaxID=2568655 RepID=A0ABW0ZK58_9ACTN|nr:universal stress protein [Nocardioides sp.]THJ06231.1 universal stress protein [Nocardioides sp.]